MAGIQPLGPLFPPLPRLAGESGTVSAGNGFANLLGQALQQVNQLQQQAQISEAELVKGQVTDFSQAIIAVQKASLAVQLTVEVRNRALEAYQEVMRMQV